jgi:hypothetical protein
MTSARTELAKSARSLIRDFGQCVTLRKMSTGSYDVDTGIRTVTTADHQARVAFTRDDYSEQSGLTTTQSRRAYVTVGDCSVSVETSDVIVGVGDNMKITKIHETFVGIDGGLLYVCTLQG